MTGVAGRIDRAAALPPGPELSAALGALPWEKVPNSRLVEVLQARSRQLAHDQAELLAGMVEISHAVAVDKLPGERAVAVARVEERFEWVSHEIAAGLTLTPTAADRELGFATAVRERLPLVFAAQLRGDIDRGKARVFVEYLDPANGEVTEAQAARLCERFVPVAPGLTTKQLSDRLYRALLAINPKLRRRRYERAVQGRGVALYLNPRTGTASLVGDGLPPDEAAAAGIDRMVEAAKRAGHPGTRGQIGADLYVGMLNGEFHGLTEAEIIHRVLAKRRPEDNPARGDADAERDAARTAAAGETTADPVAASEQRAAAGTGSACGAGSAGVAGGRAGAGGDAPGQSAAGMDRWAGERVATREGIEIRVGLATLAGLDERPGEIPGLGPIGAHLARTAVARQRRGARWVFAIVDSDGYLLLAGPLRRRPRAAAQPSSAPPVRGGVVELHLTLDELRRYATDAALADWHGVLAEIAAAWRDRDELRRRLAANPLARFARGPLADHVRIRDRSCVGPGCTRPARRSDLDHTRDHACGGETMDDNIGPACKRHHPDKERNWTLTQPEPGRFRWVSPLGRTYFTKGEPIRPDLPDPEPADHPGEETAAEVDQRLRRHEPRIVQRPAKDSPRPPPPESDPPDDEPPPF
jgi:hypothetical protein